jgi:DNA repair protein RecO (recombination protein O)
LPLVERVYRVDRTVADQRVALFGQDVAHGSEKGRAVGDVSDLPTAAPGS